MEVSDRLLCLFNADVHTENDHYIVRISRREVETGTVESGETYHVASIPRESDEFAESGLSAGPTPTSEPQSPVEVGKFRYVEAKDIGKQSDGIARVERGRTIVVPGMEIGEHVKAEITEVKPSFVVGKVVEDDF